MQITRNLLERVHDARRGTGKQIGIDFKNLIIFYRRRIFENVVRIIIGRTFRQNYYIRV